MSIEVRYRCNDCQAAEDPHVFDRTRDIDKPPDWEEWAGKHRCPECVAADDRGLVTGWRLTLLGDYAHLIYRDGVLISATRSTAAHAASVRLCELAGEEVW